MLQHNDTAQQDRDSNTAKASTIFNKNNNTHTEHRVTDMKMSIGTRDAAEGG